MTNRINERLFKKNLIQNEITVCDSKFDQNLKHENKSVKQKSNRKMNKKI